MLKKELLTQIQLEAEEAHEFKNCKSTCALSVGLGKSKIAINRIEKILNKNPKANILFSSAREVYLENFKLELIKFDHENWLDKIDFCCNKSLKNKDKIYDIIVVDRFVHIKPN